MHHLEWVSVGYAVSKQSIRPRDFVPSCSRWFGTVYYPLRRFYRFTYAGIAKW